MKIQNAEFVLSCPNVSGLPTDGLPHIAFCGRSNCGKSTLLNTLTGRKGLARVSKTPGRTRGINLFSINEDFYFADLPGFGFARVSSKMRFELGALITEYFEGASMLEGVVFLLDIRHKPSRLDQIMQQPLADTGQRVIYVATKSDKIGSTKRARQLKQIRETLALDGDAALLEVSSLERRGIKELLRALEERFLSDPPQP